MRSVVARARDSRGRGSSLGTLRATFGASWAAPGPVLVSPAKLWSPQNHAKSDVFAVFGEKCTFDSNEATRSRPEGPKIALESSKSRQERPRGAPRRHPRTAQERPRSAPGVPRAARRPKKAPHETLGGQKSDAQSHAGRANGRSEITFEIIVQKVFLDTCTPEAQEGMCRMSHKLT